MLKYEINECEAHENTINAVVQALKLKKDKDIVDAIILIFGVE